MATLDTVYIKDGVEACVVEYGTNIKLVKQLLAKGFKVTQVLPPDEKEDISYCLVWAKQLKRSTTIDAPVVVLN
jgi:hypothetical protein